MVCYSNTDVVGRNVSNFLITVYVPSASSKVWSVCSGGLLPGENGEGPRSYCKWDLVSILYVVAKNMLIK